MALNLKSIRKGLQFEVRHVAVSAVLRGDKGYIGPDNLAFFPEIGVVFNRVKKSGNTSIFLQLSELCGDNPEEFQNVEDAKYARSICCRSFSEIARIKTMHSLLCVRSPYSRALSGFLDKVAGGRNLAFRGYAGFGEPSEEAFESFLLDVSERPLPRLDRHFWPQTRLVFQTLSEFTHIAKLESLSDDMRAFLEDIGVRSDIWTKMQKPHSVEASLPDKITNAGGRLDLMNDRARKLVETIYADDFEAFSY